MYSQQHFVRPPVVRLR